MAKSLSVTELARDLSEYINRVVYKGDSFVLTRGRKTVAELRPTSAGKKLKELPAILESLPRLSREEADAFAKDIEDARAELARETVRSPWES